ncbi:MAG: hypothetical protein HY686_00945 [Chloroflexi bacterium]|nr:hypothetical protein [Chloroflexota bacterium]
MPVARVTRETLKAMIRELGGVPLTDEELDMLVPAVQGQVDAMSKLDAALDLSQVAPGLIFHAEPRR